MRFQYKYKNIDCSECFDLQNEPFCPHQLCPHVMGNLDILAGDPKFHTAIKNADACGTYLRPTLLHLNNEGLPA